MPDILQRYKEQNAIRREFEFMPATVEVLERPPAPFSRVVVLLLVCLATIAILWAVIARIDIVASGTGVVIPKGKVKVVQPLESGIVKAIAVQDGQLVKRGELLVQMDSTESSADVKNLQRELTVTRLTISRLSAQLAEDALLFEPPEDADDNEIRLHRQLLTQSILAQEEKVTAMDHAIKKAESELLSAQNRIKWLQESLPLAERLYAKKKSMAEKEMLASGRYLQAQMEINEVRKELAIEKDRADELKLSLSLKKDEKLMQGSEYRRELLKELTEAGKKQEELVQHLAKAKSRFVNRELRSPADGIVQQLSISTIGGVVTPAQPLMTIVPVDAGLEVEAKILNKDIGFVTKGMETSVKVAAYPFTRHGDLKGRIEWVGGDAVMDEQLGPVYPVRISVDSYQLPNSINGKHGEILPGMTVTTDIKVGSRRVIHYFLEPILRYKDQSLREL